MNEPPKCPVCHQELVRKAISSIAFGDEKNSKLVCINPECQRDSKLKGK